MEKYREFGDSANENCHFRGKTFNRRSFSPPPPHPAKWKCDQMCFGLVCFRPTPHIIMHSRSRTGRLIITLLFLSSSKWTKLIRAVLFNWTTCYFHFVFSRLIGRSRGHSDRFVFDLIYGPCLCFVTISWSRQLTDQQESYQAGISAVRFYTLWKRENEHLFLVEWDHSKKSPVVLMMAQSLCRNFVLQQNKSRSSTRHFLTAMSTNEQEQQVDF